MAVLAGVEVFDRDLSHFREETAKLSVHSIVFEQELSNLSFLDQTNFFLCWSEDQNFSLFFIIFDRTVRIDPDRHAHKSV